MKICLEKSLLDSGKMVSNKALAFTTIVQKKKKLDFGKMVKDLNGLKRMNINKSSYQLKNDSIYLIIKFRYNPLIY